MIRWLANDTARLSADGRYVVGFVPEPTMSYAPGDLAPPSPLNSRSLARWSVADGLETLAALPDEPFDGAVFDVTAPALYRWALTE